MAWQGLCTVGGVIHNHAVDIDLLNQGAESALGVAEEILLDSRFSYVL